MPHPYVAERLHAERRRDLYAAADRARRARLARRARSRRAPLSGLLSAWQAAWTAVSIPDPAPRVRDYPLRRPT